MREVTRSTGSPAVAENSPELRELLASIPGWRARPARLTPLHGGLHHDSYRVDSAGYEYVLRIANKDGVAGGGSRELEAYLQQQAASHGLAAPVLYVDTQRGLMLMEYLPGEEVTASQLALPELLQELGCLLRHLHKLPLCGVNFDPQAAAEEYLLDLGDDFSDRPFAKHCVDIITSTPRPRDRSCCHNDVVASNLVRGKTLRLLDFEYACDNEPLFDLASVLCWHNLGSEERRLLLGAYAGDVTEELQQRLAAQCRLYDALQWLWLAVRQLRQPQSCAAGQLAIVQKRLV